MAELRSGQSVTIDWRPTARQLGEFADDYYTEFKKAVGEIVDEVQDIARQRAPYKTGELQSSIRTSTLKTGGRVMVGFAKSRAPYAATVHWGPPGLPKAQQNPDDWFLFRVVYPHATHSRSGPMADWIVDEMQEFVNKAIRKFNRKR